MVRRGISANGRKDLVLINTETTNDHRYIEKIYQDHLVPIAPFIGDNFVIIHDNAKPHIAKIFTEQNGLDLNSIEHICDMRGKQVKAHTSFQLP